MAYKIPKVSPSALAATEHCPRFRPSGEESDAAIDGTMMHELAESLLGEPRETWDGWISALDASPEMKGLLLCIANELRTLVPDGLEVNRNYRMRMRGGKPRKSPLRPGLYPECELDRGGGRHGYIDLMYVTAEGLVYVLDYKSNRVAKDFSLQLAAYACDVNRLAPAHSHFVCRIIAPRLEEDAQLDMELGPGDLGKWNARIAAIEARADQSANDDSIRGVPCDACQYCHWSGRCRYQSEATLAVLETDRANRVTVSPKTLKATVVQSLASLVGPAGPYAGETVTADTFRKPATPAQRGLRRACCKFLEVAVAAAKKDDATWCGQFAPNDLKDMVPGFTITPVKGRSSVDETQMAAIREAVMKRFNMTITDVFDVSVIDKDLLVQKLHLDGMTKKKAGEEIDKCLEPFMTPGAPTVRWNVKPVQLVEM